MPGTIHPKAFNQTDPTSIPILQMKKKRLREVESPEITEAGSGPELGYLSSQTCYSARLSRVTPRCLGMGGGASPCNSCCLSERLEAATSWQSGALLGDGWAGKTYPNQQSCRTVLPREHLVPPRGPGPRSSRVDGSR